MEINYDASLKAYEITDISEDKSQVVYCPDGYALGENPFYQVGMAKKEFVIISQSIDGKRVNRLWLSRNLLSQLK